MRVWTTIVFVVAALGCEPEGPPGGGLPSPPGEFDDAAPLGERQDASPEERDARPLTELAGTWTGRGDTQEHGPVTARLVASADGWVFYRVVGKAHTISAKFRIVSWTGREVRVKDERGEVEMPARLSGDVLTVTAPILGSIRLERIQAGR